jgi:hypothetical protein
VGACDDRLRIYDRRMVTERGTASCVHRFSPMEHLDVFATEGVTGALARLLSAGYWWFCGVAG